MTINFDESISKDPVDRIISATSIIEMAPTDWRNVLDGYSQRLESIGRRADLPSSMIVIKEEVHEWKGMLPGGSKKEVVKVKTPRIPREGFVEELESVYTNAQKTTPDINEEFSSVLAVLKSLLHLL